MPFNRVEFVNADLMRGYCLTQDGVHIRRRKGKKRTHKQLVNLKTQDMMYLVAAQQAEKKVRRALTRSAVSDAINTQSCGLWYRKSSAYRALCMVSNRDPTSTSYL